MPLDLGWTTIDDESARILYSFSSLIDLDPASSNLGDAVGDHYDILKAACGIFLLCYRIRGQKSFGARRLPSQKVFSQFQLMLHTC